jgi:hypothetical protein
LDDPDDPGCAKRVASSQTFGPGKTWGHWYGGNVGVGGGVTPDLLRESSDWSRLNLF